MSFDEQMEILLTEANKIETKLDAVLRQYESLPNNHRDKLRMHVLLERFDAMLKRNSQKISILIAEKDDIRMSETLNLITERYRKVSWGRLYWKLHNPRMRRFDNEDIAIVLNGASCIHYQTLDALIRAIEEAEAR